MKKSLSILAATLVLLTAFNSCSKKTETLKGRDAIVGTYNFTNTYSLYQWNNAQQREDTVNATDTYVITIEPGAAPNDIIINGMLRQLQTQQASATISAAGDVLFSTDGNFASFQGLINGGNITFNYSVYGGPNGLSEKGQGTATKR
jgi:hypothetical protein